MLHCNIDYVSKTTEIGNSLVSTQVIVALNEWRSALFIMVHHLSMISDLRQNSFSVEFLHS